MFVRMSFWYWIIIRQPLEPFTSSEASSMSTSWLSTTVLKKSIFNTSKYGAMHRDWALALSKASSPAESKSTRASWSDFFKVSLRFRDFSTSWVRITLVSSSSEHLVAMVSFFVRFWQLLLFFHPRELFGQFLYLSSPGFQVIPWLVQLFVKENIVLIMWITHFK